jgi:hypothetical protein
MQGFCKQLVHDLKQSWQKTAVLGVLLLVGMYFWVPPLYRTVFAKSATPTPAVSSTPTDTATSPPSTSAPSSPGLTTATGTSSSRDSVGGKSSINWENIAAALQSDPLLQSADADLSKQNPFGIDHEQFPLVGSFTPDPEPTDKSTETVAEADADRLPDSLVLRSTIVGARRKAAFINRKLYLEGSIIDVDGRAFLLAAVHSRHVVLTQGKHMYELGLPETANEKPINTTPSRKSD